MNWLFLHCGIANFTERIKGVKDLNITSTIDAFKAVQWCYIIEDIQSFTHSMRSVLSSQRSQRISFYHTNPNLVSDNKVRREAAVAMGLTGTGESSPVVPRRQGGSVSLWALTLFALFRRIY